MHTGIAWRRVGGALVVVLALAACGSGGTTQTPTNASTGATAAPVSGSKPTVIATTTQLEDVVGVLGGERVTVVGLVPRNGDPHEFEPTPDDVKHVAGAQAVFKNGVGLEGWLDKLSENAGGQRPIIDVSQGITLGKIDRAFDEGGEIDPHIWMSPLNMIAVTDNVVAGLKQLDPAGAATFTANGAAYKQKLQELDAYAEKTLAAVPTERRKLVTAHDAMGYFASRYTFEIIGTVIPSGNTEAAETSAKQLSTLVDTINAAGVPAIFAEASNNPKFIEQVAAESKVHVKELYVDSLGPVGGEAGTYLDFFKTDVDTIAAALK